MTDQTIQNILVMALPTLLAITLSASAQGYVARYFGDPTPQMMGRLSLNPVKHIDLLGTIIIPLLILVVSGGTFMFGYAKPVPITHRNLRDPQKAMTWIALSGPLSNIAQAFVWAIVLFALLLMSTPMGHFFTLMAAAGLSLNLVYAAINLIPIPPLPGGSIAINLLPYQAASALSKITPYGFFIVTGLLFTGILQTIWINPIVGVLRTILLFPLRFFLN